MDFFFFVVVVGLTGFSFLEIDHRGINIKTKRKKAVMH